MAQNHNDSLLATAQVTTRVCSTDTEPLTISSPADIHFYLSPPNSTPLHDAFWKEAHLSLFFHDVHRELKLKLTHTPNGLDGGVGGECFKTATVNHDKRQPNLITLVINQGLNAASVPGELAAWTLLLDDIRHEGRRLHQIHSIDIYFWTAEDCRKFLAAYGTATLPDHYVPSAQKLGSSTNDTSSTGHAETVAQRLEHVALSEALSPKMATDDQLRSSVKSQDTTTESRANATGLSAYNPAAPGAPETVFHREKTPPPVCLEADTDSVPRPANHAALSYAHQQAYALPPPTPSSHVYGSNALPLQPSIYFPPPPNEQTASSNISAPTSYVPNVTTGNPQSPYTPTFPPPQYATHHRELYDTPLHSPAYPSLAPLASPTFPPPPSGPPSASTSSPEISNAMSHAQSHHSSIHQQFYQPTESELAHGHHGHHKSVTKAQGHSSSAKKTNQESEGTNSVDSPKRGRLESNLGRLDKSVNKFFKKLERI